MGYIEMLSDQIGRTSEKEAIYQMVTTSPRMFVTFFSTLLMVAIATMYPIQSNHIWTTGAYGFLVAILYFVTCRMMKWSPFVIAIGVLLRNAPALRKKTKKEGVDMMESVEQLHIDDQVAEYVQKTIDHDLIYHTVIYMTVLIYIIMFGNVHIPYAWILPVPIATLAQYALNRKFEKEKVPEPEQIIKPRTIITKRDDQNDIAY
jgi:hypothetical protein